MSIPDRIAIFLFLAKLTFFTDKVEEKLSRLSSYVIVLLHFYGCQVQGHCGPFEFYWLIQGRKNSISFRAILLDGTLRFLCFSDLEIL